jgi:hypothetical protein
MILYPVFLLLLFTAAALPQISTTTLRVESAAGYPRWLCEGNYRTDQTSGIAYIGGDNFLLADDIGILHRLTITQDTIFTFHKVSFSKEVDNFLSGFPKKDFEEILYDHHTGKVLISIEGNKPLVKETVGIYEIKFYNDDLFSDSVISISKLRIEPEEVFLKYTDNNIGFEGLAADSLYYYAALEGFSEGFLFADSTLLYVIDKNDLEIKKVLSTRDVGIETICGLYADEELSLYGIDRNNRNLFHIKFNDQLDITDVSIENISSAIPNYNSFNYVAAFESLTMDDKRNIYIVDDPWRTFYVPSQNILLQLDEKTVRKFKDFIPVIYKFNLVY